MNENKTIFKYELQPYTELELPKNAKILSVNTQKNIDTECIYVWVLIDRKIKETEKRKFVTYGTGHPIPDDIHIDFIGTVFFKNGLVFHIFEKLEEWYSIPKK